MSSPTQRRPTRGKRRAKPPFGQRHRKKIVIGSLLAVLLPVLGIGGYLYALNSKIDNIDKVETSLKEKDRPDPDRGKALNILLLGSDAAEPKPGQDPDSTIAEDAAAPVWPDGKYRSDTLMVVHITADRKRAFLMSIPRDTLTTLYDAEGQPRGQGKINAAFSDYGPQGAIATVENLTNLRMEHLAIIDWEGFESLSTAVGGVPVTIPTSFYDPQQKIQWNAGPQLLRGENALAYVRTRYGLANGDFDRIKRQQNFMRSLMKKMLDRGTMTNPTKLLNTMSALTENLTVDAEWSAGDMRSLALSMRQISVENVVFLTTPVAGTADIAPYGSVVQLDQVRSDELYAAFRADTVDAYLGKYPDEALGDQVN